MAKFQNAETSGPRFEAELEVGEHSLQLYSLGTPNGQKVTILLEELGLAYDCFSINIMEGANFASGFVAINPNEKIPALVDKDGPGGKEFSVFESGAILLYLVDKVPDSPMMPRGDDAARSKVMQWLMWQMGSAPYLGQFGHFSKYAKEKIPYAIDRYTMETKRLLDVLDKRLALAEYVAGDFFSLADIAIFPWIRCLDVFYNAAETLGLSEYKNVARWVESVGKRPAVVRGMAVSGFNEDAKHYSSAGSK